MSVNRRKFLANIAGAATAGFAVNRFTLSHVRSGLAATPKCAILNSGRTCCLQESLAGYRVALTEIGVNFVEVGPQSLIASQTLIIPSLMEIEPEVAQTILAFLCDGTCLVLESGAGFVAPSAFDPHQALLYEHFGIATGPVVDLWAERGARGRVPYVDYAWPHSTKVRDFSRALPLSTAERGIIGWAQSLPVALKRKVGKGTLIFLGSPLGPALWMGDREARLWLRDVMAQV